MQRYGRTLREAARAYEHEINAVLTKTLTLTPLQSFVMGETAYLGFPRRAGIRGSVELSTKYGPMELYLGQTLDGVEDNATKQIQLRARNYEYQLQPVTMSDRLVRWEYVRLPGERDYWNRHHIQGAISVDVPDRAGNAQTIHLNDWHLPTGPVTIEDVIRFCLHDLGVRPLTGVDSADIWNALLIASSERSRP